MQENSTGIEEKEGEVKTKTWGCHTLLTIAPEDTTSTFFEISGFNFQHIFILLYAMSLIKIHSLRAIKEIFVVNVSSPILEPWKKNQTNKKLLVIWDALYAYDRHSTKIDTDFTGGLWWTVTNRHLMSRKGVFVLFCFVLFFKSQNVYWCIDECDAKSLP